MIEIKITTDKTDQCGSCGKPAVLEARTSTYPQLVHSTKYCHSCAALLHTELEAILLGK
jgi:hypothetical protein